MSLSCAAILPLLLCTHRDLLLYLAPSLVFALAIRALTACHPIFFVLTLPGTLCHELAHFCVGLVTGARPTSLSIVPYRSGERWQLGSVRLANLRWYNAAPAALAPFLLLLLPLGVGLWRTQHSWRFAPLDLALCLLLAPQLLAFWPSWTDWKLAARSWPYVVVLTGLACIAYFLRY